MYAARYVKHQAVAHFLEYREELFDEVVEAIRMEYGRVDSEFGPFTVREYLHFINKPREYGDFIMLKLISSMWAVKITVLRSDSLREVRFRHDADIDDVDIVLVYNSKPINGHYSPAICVEGGEAETLEIREDMVKSKHYDPEVDRLERKSLGFGDGKKVQIIKISYHQRMRIPWKRELEVLEQQLKKVDRLENKKCQKGV